MTVTLTPEQHAWLSAQVAHGRFSSIEEGVRQLIDENISIEEDDLAWAKPYVDKGLKELEEGKFITLEEHKARNADRLNLKK